MHTPDTQPSFFPEETLQTKLVRNGFWLYFFQALLAPAGLIVKLMISHEMTPEDIGLFYSMMGLVGIASAYSDLGLTEALQYYLPRYLIDRQYAQTKTIVVFTILVQLVTGVLLAGGVYMVAPRVATAYFHAPDAAYLLQYFCIYFLLINFFQVMGSLFVSTQQVKWSQGIEVVRMRTIVAGTYRAMTADLLYPIVFVQIWLTGLLVGLVVAAIGGWKVFGYIYTDYPFVRSKKLLQTQWMYGLRILLGTGAGTLLGQINQQYALYYLGAKAAGYWTNYLSFYTIVGVITGPLIGYLFPLLNELYKKNDHHKIIMLYRLLFAGCAVFGLVGGVVGYFWAGDIGALLFGETFRVSGELFAHYAPWVFTIPLIGILFQDIASRGMVKQRVWIVFLSLLANAGMSFLLGPIYGLIGLVYAQLTGNLVLTIGAGWYWYHKK